MPIDTDSHEFQILLRQFEKGNVVLFAGAGFSIGAQNSLGEDPPLGGDLARRLAEECGWPYTGEELPVVYDQAQKHLGTRSLVEFLERLYRNCTPSPWQRELTGFHWYRIYTTNIDDVVEQAYAAGSVQRLEPLVCPTPFIDQDQWFERVQCVHLHGSILDSSKPLTFTLDDFAYQTATVNPWYQAMIEDMMSKAFVFVGARLNDPPFHHYLALRSQRSRGIPEVRAKAFLVSPSVGPIRRRQLEDHNMVVFEVPADEFFTTLKPFVRKAVPTRLDLLRNRYPHQISAINSGLLDQHSTLLKYFDFVTADIPIASGHLRSLFFDGAEPTWLDIASNLDAPRRVTADFLATMRPPHDGVRSFLIVGHAGSGKSTLMRRLAVELSREGRTVYYLRVAERIDKKAMLTFLASIGTKEVFFFIDEAATQLEICDDLVRSFSSASITLVFADRPHAVLPRLGTLRSLRPHLLDMPMLNKDDSEAIIKKLMEFGQLGQLQGMSRQEQLREFLSRSKKQLLVAMKEATSGRGFDAILTNEFYSLASESARLAYTIACVAYMHGAPVSRRHLVACMEGTDLERASVLANELREVVVPWREGSDYLCPRHRVIAHQVATESAPPKVRREAVVALLTQVSPDITPYNISRRSPEYIAYRGLINHDNMLLLFGEDYDVISEIYHELKGYYCDQFLFWLQFGRGELYFDHFAVAENYLNQSLGIRSAESGNYQALHHMGVLFLKRALAVDDVVTGEIDARRGEEILVGQIKARGASDTYPYEALITHKLRWIKRRGGPKVPEELDSLHQVAKEAVARHPFDDRITSAHQRVFREYLMTTVTPSVVDVQQQELPFPPPNEAGHRGQ